MVHPDTGRPVDFTMPDLLTETRFVRPGFGGPDDADGEPSGPVGEHDDRLADDRLAQVSAYGAQLWRQLNEVAAYLRDEVARGGALSTPMPHGDEQWSAWQECYAQTLSALAGPRGDNGFGAQESTVERNHGQPATG